MSGQRSGDPRNHEWIRGWNAAVEACIDAVQRYQDERWRDLTRQLHALKESPSSRTEQEK